jgi:very-short-patch-repair endonuclease
MPKRIDNARLLRHRSTDAERRLWYFVRNRQLDGCRFRRQAPLGRYVADFVCVERRLVVELDGSQHADEAERDAARTRSLEDAGFVVLRFWNNDVSGNVEGVLEVIIRHLVARATPSPPNPPLEGEG